jgi:uncharacterized protein
MENIKRFVATEILADIGKQKVLMLYGSRRVGKTKILDDIKAIYGDKALYVTGEDLDVQSIFKNRTIKNYTLFVGDYKIIIIDEAQYIEEVGLCLKLMIDQIKGITIIASGSSSFDLSNATGEPLVGRNYTFRLYPFAQQELKQIENLLDTKGNFEERMIYGNYPELVYLKTKQEKERYLQEIVNSYLLKDILALENVKDASILKKLLQLLAFQIGSEVSTNELSNTLGISQKTVDRYLDLLTKVFIIYPLTAYSTNQRKEIVKSKKWYFSDNGLRNALIKNYNVVGFRNDVGILWEQYCLNERIKFNQYKKRHVQYYFWRTYDGQEIDFIEIEGDKMEAFECKFSKDKIKTPAAFAKFYPNVQVTVLNKNNYLEYIME